MSEIERSASSVSSGPRPNSSLNTSVISASRSDMLSGTLLDSLSSSVMIRLRISGSAWAAADAVEPLEVQTVQQRAVDPLLGLLVVGLADVDDAARHHTRTFGNGHVGRMLLELSAGRRAGRTALS